MCSSLSLYRSIALSLFALVYAAADRGHESTPEDCVDLLPEASSSSSEDDFEVSLAPPSSSHALSAVSLLLHRFLALLLKSILGV
jgi:hypothetical protein